MFTIPNQMNDSLDSHVSSQIGGSWSSCIEMIVKYCSEDEVLEMMNIEPLQVFLTKFSPLRSFVFFILFVFQIIFMSVYSAIVLPITFEPASNYNNSTPVLDNNMRSRISNKFTGTAYILMVSSVLMLLLNCLYFLTLCRPTHCVRGFCSWWRKFSFVHSVLGLKKEASVSSYISYFNIQSDILRVVSPIMFVIWFFLYVTSDSESNYVGITTSVLVIGWLQIIDYTKGFSGIYAFYFTLKLVLVRDLLRIAVVYVFILVGFSCALVVLLQTNSPWNGDIDISAKIFYEIYGTMLGRGESFSLASGFPFKYISIHGLRIFICTYIFLSTILILNISIAATGNAFSQVSDLKKTLWCIETIYFVDWISQDVGCKSCPPWRAILFRKYLNRYVFKHDDIGPYIEKKIKPTHNANN